MLPILTSFSIFVGLWGGSVISETYLGVSSRIYFDQLYSTIRVADIVHGITKTVFFAGIFSIVCCYMGLNAKNGAQGVGKNTMLAIVISLSMIIISDYLLSWFMG